MFVTHKNPGMLSFGVRVANTKGVCNEVCCTLHPTTDVEFTDCKPRVCNFPLKCHVGEEFMAALLRLVVIVLPLAGILPACLVVLFDQLAPHLETMQRNNSMIVFIPSCNLIRYAICKFSAVCQHWRTGSHPRQSQDVSLTP